MSKRQDCPYCGAQVKAKYIWNHIRSRHPGAYTNFGWAESDPNREDQDDPT